jgi:hypothetical protein
MLLSLAGQQETIVPHKGDFDARQKNLSDTEKKLLREIFGNLIETDKSHNSLSGSRGFGLQPSPSWLGLLARGERSRPRRELAGSLASMWARPRRSLK